MNRKEKEKKKSLLINKVYGKNKLFPLPAQMRFIALLNI